MEGLIEIAVQNEKRVRTLSMRLEEELSTHSSCRSLRERGIWQDRQDMQEMYGSPSLPPCKPSLGKYAES